MDAAMTTTRHKMDSALCNKAVHLRRLPQVGYCPCVLDKGHAHGCRCGCPAGATADSLAVARRSSYKEIIQRHLAEARQETKRRG